jgi:ribosomal protein S18 acetylase RimI-like enzyme
MDPLIIRPMTEKDIPATAQVLAEAFNSSAAMTAKQLAEPPRRGQLIQAFIATRGDKVLGMTLCQRTGQGLGIDLLAVDKDHRKQGLGGKLMRHTEKFMQRHWLDGEEADVLIEDLTKRTNNMSRYYENMGYKEWFGLGSTGMPLLYKTLKP